MNIDQEKRKVLLGESSASPSLKRERESNFRHQVEALALSGLIRMSNNSKSSVSLGKESGHQFNQFSLSSPHMPTMKRQKMDHSALSATAAAAAHTNTLFPQYNAFQALPFAAANTATASSVAAAPSTNPYFPSAHSSSASPNAEMVKLQEMKLQLQLNLMMQHQHYQNQLSMLQRQQPQQTLSQPSSLSQRQSTPTSQQALQQQLKHQNGSSLSIPQLFPSSQHKTYQANCRNAKQCFPFPSSQTKQTYRIPTMLSNLKSYQTQWDQLKQTLFPSSSELSFAELHLLKEEFKFFVNQSRMVVQDDLSCTQQFRVLPTSAKSLSSSSSSATTQMSKGQSKSSEYALSPKTTNGMMTSMVNSGTKQPTSLSGNGSKRKENGNDTNDKSREKPTT
uniref:Uncharacterized protein n=1 Tax=Ditylum brightwellii TaxID=49249 RepID=A0A6U3XCA8_9STRA|mmetsp:Transcript_22502/g.33489  ORF Transcript_22502/g.33489 Transcript_22502/m.33489 type:complete len:393 (+) Transcript_22502:95-1273(+)